jgi:hypothetical protein
MSYIVAALSAFALAAATYAGVTTWRLSATQMDLLERDIALKSCAAGMRNLVEDMASDAEVDRIPPHRLPSVPERWLRPYTGSSPH